MTDWKEPATWNAGDVLNSENWVARVNDPLGLLLRRPLTALRRTTDLSVSNNTDTAIPWNTVDQDDDGMIIYDLPSTTIVAQRAGVFSYWVAATWVGNGTSSGGNMRVSLYIVGQGDYRWRQAPCEGSGVGQSQYRSLSGELNLHEGDQIEFHVWQQTGSSATVKAENHGPRAVVMWKRPL